MSEQQEGRYESSYDGETFYSRHGKCELSADLATGRVAINEIRDGGEPLRKLKLIDPVLHLAVCGAISDALMASYVLKEREDSPQTLRIAQLERRIEGLLDLIAGDAR